MATEGYSDDGEPVDAVPWISNIRIVGPRRVAEGSNSCNNRELENSVR